MTPTNYSSEKTRLKTINERLYDEMHADPVLDSEQKVLKQSVLSKIDIKMNKRKRAKIDS